MSLSVFLPFCPSLIVHHKGKGTTAWFLFERNGIECVIVRIDVSDKIVHNKLFFQESGGKSLHFFLLMLDAQERPV